MNDYENDVPAVVSRVSIDIDGHFQNPRLLVLKAVQGLKQAGATETKVAVSSSGEGYHVVGHFDHYVPPGEKLHIRRQYGDDGNRRLMDDQRADIGHPTGTMWRKKGGNEGERVEFETVDEAFGHTALSQDWSEKAKAIQQHGHKAVRDALVPHSRGVKAAQ